LYTYPYESIAHATLLKTNNEGNGVQRTARVKKVVERRDEKMKDVTNSSDYIDALFSRAKVKRFMAGLMP
jgi:hypothetical protein